MFEELLRSIPAEPPRSYPLLPGLRYDAALPRGLLLLLPLFICFVLLVPTLVLFTAPQSRLSREHSASIDAQVVAVADSASCRSQARQLSYAFTPPQGVEYRGSAVVCANSPYYAAKVGDHLPVQYLPAEPGVNAMSAARDQNAPPPFLFLLFPLFFVLVLSAIFMPLPREVRRARKAFRKGRLALGHVVYVKRRQTSGWSNTPGLLSHDVYISYLHASGARQEDRAWCNNDWLLHQLSPGSAVHIAYLPERPEQIVLLEAFLR